MRRQPCKFRSTAECNSPAFAASVTTGRAQCSIRRRFLASGPGHTATAYRQRSGGSLLDPIPAAGLVNPSTPLPETAEPFVTARSSPTSWSSSGSTDPNERRPARSSTTSSRAAPLPQPGTIWIVTDGTGRARAVLRTTEVRIGPRTSVDGPFAWDEGEGQRTREWWLAAHQEFFRRYLPTIGVDFDPDVATVFERFDMLFAEGRQGHAPPPQNGPQTWKPCVTYRRHRVMRKRRSGAA
jgi:uncharacterized protein YhfF